MKFYLRRRDAGRSRAEEKHPAQFPSNRIHRAPFHSHGSSTEAVERGDPDNIPLAARKGTEDCCCWPELFDVEEIA